MDKTEIQIKEIHKVLKALVEKPISKQKAIGFKPD
jgi:hypothetical protein